jgi:hypothetical protein
MMTRAAVVKELVVPARQLVDFLHILLNRFGNGGNLLTAGFPALFVRLSAKSLNSSKGVRKL